MIRLWAISFLSIVTGSGCAWMNPTVSGGVVLCDHQDDCPEGTLCYRNHCLETACDNDGVVGLGERCDDGNTSDEDGCSPLCEPARCGDGIVRTDLDEGGAEYEACDDGNIEPLDGCLNNCRRARCGDGLRRTDRVPGEIGFEACDDGNLSSEDGCLPDCELPHCGDGVLLAANGEVCDDGNDSNGDACVSGCQPARCGDGFRRTDLDLGRLGYEACDDGNDSNEDACRNDCQLNECGDGYLHREQEECEDGNFNDNDACLTDCSLARCGDGHVWSEETAEGEAEACDDGNDDEHDGCRTDCTVARCGDGVLRRDLNDMSLPGFEACEPNIDVGNERCRSDCLLGPLPRMISVGRQHACALRGGEVWCVGNLQRYEFDGDDDRFEVGPMHLDLLTGENMTFARSVGSSRCWLNRAGAAFCHRPDFYFGDYVGVPYVVPLMEVAYQSYSRAERCALNIHGRVLCWSGDRPYPTEIDGLRNMVSLAKREDLGCAVDLEGQVHCWRDGRPVEVLDESGQAIDVEVGNSGQRIFSLHNTGELVALAGDQAVQGIVGGVRQFSLHHAQDLGCAVTTEGDLFCTGSFYLPVFQEAATARNQFIEIPIEGAVREVSVGDEGGFLLMQNGELRRWGRGWEIDPINLGNLRQDTEIIVTPVRIEGFPAP